jgi:hypothetical protein
MIDNERLRSGNMSGRRRTVVTESRRQLNEFLLESASVLKRAGFRKRGLDWTRQRGDAIQGINVQPSRGWGFHVNVGVGWPQVYELVWERTPRYTAQYGPGNVRLDRLTGLPYRDSSEALALALETDALPWLERALDPHVVASNTNGQWSVALLLVAGDVEAAHEEVERVRRRLEAVTDPQGRDILENSVSSSLRVIDRWRKRQREESAETP